VWIDYHIADSHNPPDGISPGVLYVLCSELGQRWRLVNTIIKNRWTNVSCTARSRTLLLPLPHIRENSAIWAHTSGRQTTGLTRGSPHIYYLKGGEPGFEAGVWRPEMWALGLNPFVPRPISSGVQLKMSPLLHTILHISGSQISLKKNVWIHPQPFLLHFMSRFLIAWLPLRSLDKYISALLGSSSKLRKFKKIENFKKRK
jgi:hypothetical protein